MISAGLKAGKGCNLKFVTQRNRIFKKSDFFRTRQVPSLTFFSGSENWLTGTENSGFRVNQKIYFLIFPGMTVFKKSLVRYLNKQGDGYETSYHIF
jgi:hypothetical protein